ncbi:hypothetical protein DACRYDRAFT_103445 [Dacryopinax primogenitus]|uniref:Uncharacterized protein n=1 Tax=Dacryopinax primogenitus (strain DJM 731) TaxID=1858805 RepID=M5GH25_DACPD|nr:uncharacterized protein DACRYDRAFT_103445 [Dacryopinax primogenitus]EJU06498.1 hypothetical protein DACRYDRAFT_103445 [Dacryopinax primogenitus]
MSLSWADQGTCCRRAGRDVPQKGKERGERDLACPGIAWRSNSGEGVPERGVMLSRSSTRWLIQEGSWKAACPAKLDRVVPHMCWNRRAQSSPPSHAQYEMRWVRNSYRLWARYHLDECQISRRRSVAYVTQRQRDGIVHLLAYRYPDIRHHDWLSGAAERTGYTPSQDFWRGSQA